MRFVGRLPLMGIIAAGLVVSSTGHAVHLAAACLLEADNITATAEGTNPEKILPIASVSKVVTSWWAVNALGADYRFPTKFYVTAIGKDQYDVHIEGSRDPLFGDESMEFAISQLNAKGINKIRHLSFDENFKYLHNVNTNHHVITDSWGPLDPSPRKVESQFEDGRMLRNWSRDQKVLSLVGVPLKEKPSLDADSIDFVQSTNFHAPPKTKAFVMRSAPLTELLKEMNRLSNNHAANQIFEHLGGAEPFGPYIKSGLGLDPSKIRFVNGAGTPLHGQYNRASCATMLYVLKDLRRTLIGQGKDLQDVMAVIGIDTASTVSRIYENSTTKDAVIGKTGTIANNITLAGLMMTQKGNYYFMYNIATHGMFQARQGRNKIRELLTAQIRKFGGGKAIKYSIGRFTSVDGDSDFDDSVEVKVEPKK